jgi:hypothetical protein
MPCNFARAVIVAMNFSGTSSVIANILGGFHSIVAPPATEFPCLSALNLQSLSQVVSQAARLTLKQGAAFRPVAVRWGCDEK